MYVSKSVIFHKLVIISFTQWHSLGLHYVMNKLSFNMTLLFFLKQGQETCHYCMPKSLHALITSLPSITWKIYHSTTTDLAHK